MVNAEEILKSMLEEMEKYQKEYNEATKQVNDILREYTTKIDELQKQRLALQEEGNKKIDILNARREQLSGKHSSLYEQYKKFAGKEPEFSKVETDVEPEKKVAVKKPAKKVEPKKPEKATPVNEDNKTESLSPEELAKLEEITNKDKSNDKPTVDKNGNEIPEYLQDAYKK